MFRRELSQIAIILGFSFLFAFGYNAIRENGISLLAQKKVFEEADVSDIEKLQPRKKIEPEIKMVDLLLAKKLFDKGITFVDARDESDYLAGHIKGALFVSPIQLREIIDFDDPVVTYCEGEECELSIEYAESLSEFGFSTIFVFRGGWPEWKAAGFPVEGTP